MHLMRESAKTHRQIATLLPRLVVHLGTRGQSSDLLLWVAASSLFRDLLGCPRASPSCDGTTPQLADFLQRMVDDTIIYENDNASKMSYISQYDGQ